MLDFIVLGYVPGTSIQITFAGFLRFAILLTSLIVLANIVRLIYVKFGSTIMLYHWYMQNWLRGTTI